LEGKNFCNKNRTKEELQLFCVLNAIYFMQMDR